MKKEGKQMNLLVHNNGLMEKQNIADDFIAAMLQVIYLYQEDSKKNTLSAGRYQPRKIAASLSSGCFGKVYECGIVHTGIINSLQIY